MGNECSSCEGVFKQKQLRDTIPYNMEDKNMEEPTLPHRESHPYKQQLQQQQLPPLMDDIEHYIGNDNKVRSSDHQLANNTHTTYVRSSIAKNPFISARSSSHLRSFDESKEHRTQATAHEQSTSVQQIDLQNNSKHNNTIMTAVESSSMMDATNSLITRDAIELENGVIYLGQWWGNLRQGIGIQKWPDGAVYEGEWKNDQAHGKGKFTHGNGDVFEGEWRDDQANGFGKFTHADGSYYEGQWKDDLQHGYGEHRWNDGSQYSGISNSGRKHGQGTYHWADGSTYTGNWANNLLHGYGVYVWKDGRIYKGFWKDNCMEGRGKYTWTDGRFYEGSYQKDKRHGYGVYSWRDGKTYEGYWFEGKQHGKGRMTTADGVSSDAVYSFGKRVRGISEREFSETINLEKAKHFESLQILAQVEAAKIQGDQVVAPTDPRIKGSSNQIQLVGNNVNNSNNQSQRIQGNVQQEALSEGILKQKKQSNNQLSEQSQEIYSSQKKSRNTENVTQFIEGQQMQLNQRNQGLNSNTNTRKISSNFFKN